MDDRQNDISSVFTVIGIISITLGLFLGIYYIANQSYNSLGALQGVIGWTIFITGVLWGIVFFGFSKVIKLLQGIYNRMEENQHYASEFSITTNARVFSDSEESNKNNVPDHARSEIVEFFKEQEIQQISGTKLDDFYIVKVNDHRFIIELGGFTPKKVTQKRAKGLGII
ncbi:hypothetical protein GH741_20625 [Aquibacillus halophilus]|uniref:Uncharacterized protein n=1 Tax=Aquibacillus halophilus TaxID=930132 RepID=A0A6A8DIG4_9BACI|nr:hypothetical protein [Aquibacillus halophilus]MRH45050.1 hypothetical protein [Aquibacillus halophilus]